MPPPPTVVKEGQVDDDVGSGAVANTPEVTGDDSPAIATVEKKGESKPSGVPQGTFNVATKIIMTPNTPGANKPEEFENASMTSQRSPDDESSTSDTEEDEIYQNDVNIFQYPFPQTGTLCLQQTAARLTRGNVLSYSYKKIHQQQSMPVYDVMT